MSGDRVIVSGAMERKSQKFLRPRSSATPNGVTSRNAPHRYWPRQAIASPDMLIVWEKEFGLLPEPIDEIIDRCRLYVQAAAPDLKVGGTKLGRLMSLARDMKTLAGCVLWTRFWRHFALTTSGPLSGRFWLVCPRAA